MRFLASFLAIGLFAACGKVTAMPDASTGDDDVAPDAPEAPPDADPCAGVDPTGSQTYNFTGAVQTFVVPDCVTELNVDAFGAQGGQGDTNAPGGLGGRAQGTVPVTPGETLLIYVGGAGTTVSNNGDGGFNGGGGVVECCGTAPSGTGGGASDVRRGADLTGRLIIAGGGGGGGWQTFAGGGGGGLVGIDGVDQSAAMPGGDGGTQTAGGAAGWIGVNYPNDPGSLGQGGRCWHDGAGCGAGGGGYYGGGTGGFAGAGGGSSFIDSPGTLNGQTTAAVNAGNGTVYLSW